MKVFISQPMKNRTEEDIMAERKVITEKLNAMHIEVIDTIFNENAPMDFNVDFNTGVYYLGKSILKMAEADAIFMCEGWNEARGCRIERQVAQDYGIKILYEDFFTNKPYIATRGLKNSREGVN